MYICAYVTKTRIIWFGHALSWMLFGSSAIFALQLIYFHFIYCVLSHHVSRLKPRTTDRISDISKLKPLDVFQQVTTHFHPFPLERLLSKPTVYSCLFCHGLCLNLRSLSKIKMHNAQAGQNTVHASNANRRGYAKSNVHVFSLMQYGATLPLFLLSTWPLPAFPCSSVKRGGCFSTICRKHASH